MPKVSRDSARLQPLWRGGETLRPQMSVPPFKVTRGATARYVPGREVGLAKRPVDLVRIDATVFHPS
jgi:hypothetical protein